MDQIGGYKKCSRRYRSRSHPKASYRKKSVRSCSYKKRTSYPRKASYRKRSSRRSKKFNDVAGFVYKQLAPRASNACTVRTTERTCGSDPNCQWNNNKCSHRWGVLSQDRAFAGPMGPTGGRKRSKRSKRKTNY